ncbi:hypothetical protein [uncultured Culturomica sp.]|uniref:hypothetical protein n=1 Tax=uncultured Culturomica sp. TaxID=1926654 RepID=UPI002593282D|nr:hypothetical protein [uncultured Culturomica sp.]
MATALLLDCQSTCLSVVLAGERVTLRGSSSPGVRIRSPGEIVTETAGTITVVSSEQANGRRKSDTSIAEIILFIILFIVLFILEYA